jgi:hypothetical protein
VPGGPADIVDGSVGRLVPYGEPGPLAQAIVECVELARDPHVPARCRERAARFDWIDTVGPGYEALYRELVDALDAR